MMPRPQSRKRVITLNRNRGAFLLGMSWVHASEWDERTVHFYLGWWTLTCVVAVWKGKRCN